MYVVGGMVGGLLGAWVGRWVSGWVDGLVCMGARREVRLSYTWQLLVNFSTSAVYLVPGMNICKVLKSQFVLSKGF